MAYTFLLGGVRSGKSALAQRLAEESGRQVSVIVTAEPRDEEMRERIRRHQAARPSSWRTVEAPIELLGAVAAAPVDHFLLVDCVTLWVANLLERGVDDEALHENVKDLVFELETRSAACTSTGWRRRPTGCSGRATSSGGWRSCAIRASVRLVPPRSS